MSIITRFIISIYYEIFFIVYLGIYALLLVVQVFDKLDEFIKSNVEIRHVFIYFLNLSPALIVDIFPLVFVFSFVIFFLFISKSNEMLALRTLGISHKSILKVFLINAFILSSLMAISDFLIVPHSNRKVSEIWYDKLKKKERKGFFQGNLLFYKGERQIWIAENMSGDGKLLKNIVIFNITDKNQLEKILSVNELKNINENKWMGINLYDISINRSVDNQDNIVSFTKYNTKELNLSEKPDDFIILRNSPIELNANDLISSIIKTRRAGSVNFEAETVFFNKLLFSFMCVSLVFALIPIILPSKKDELVFAVAKTIMITTVSWALWKFSFNLGKTGKIFPLIPFLFIYILLIIGGIYYLRKMKF